MENIRRKLHSRARIGAELCISHKTASVHVSNILRRPGVSGRAQAAALAERAGLLSARGSKARRRESR